MKWALHIRAVAAIAVTAFLCLGQESPAYRSSVNLVLVDAAVTGSRGVPVAGLTKESFRILENGAERDIAQFAGGASPISLALIVDYSASMRPRRGAVVSGSETLLSLLRPEDEVSLIVFNDSPRVARQGELMSSVVIPEWRMQLLETATTGRTALYDSIGEAFEALAEARHERKVIILLSDGEDTQSSTTLERTLAQIQSTNTLIFCVGLFSPGEPDTNAGALRKLAEASGGSAVFDKDGKALSETLSRILTDIRARYILAFRPEQAKSERDEVRKLTVEAKDASGRRLKVRSRTQYRVAPSEPVGNN